MVEEILLASRLDQRRASSSRGRRLRSALLGLAAEEAARVEATVAGLPVGGRAGRGRGRRHPAAATSIRNLLENAAKHGRPPIQISRHERVTKTAPASSSPTRDKGISASERERVFEPFYRPAGRGESAGGWGLGLSLVRQIAMRHGGAVSCDAEPGGGSRFVADLAMGQSQSSGSDRRNQAAPDRRSARGLFDPALTPPLSASAWRETPSPNPLWRPDGRGRSPAHPPRHPR